MKVFAVCMECQIELGHPGFEPFMIPYFDDRIGYVECSRGHKSALMLQSQKFEVLMESGSEALLSGFTLEACASFSSALERVYEFAIKVFILNRGVSKEIFTKMFKEMSRQSERQLGAFMALYLTEVGKVYVPDQNVTKFRNGVIHKGEIPTESDAREYCSKVYSIIRTLTDVLCHDFSDAMNKAIHMDISERMKKIKPEIRITTSTGTNFFNLKSSGQATFEEALKIKKDAMEMFEGTMPVMRLLSQIVNDIKPMK
ncbi:hypothetical protein ACRQKW_000682 [Citrobacter braakii]|uniref:hypothetical protein n=1 Tax=Citrobacter europaeus TaxID=1914243 RepID=UPI0037DF5026